MLGTTISELHRAEQDGETVMSPKIALGWRVAALATVAMVSACGSSDGTQPPATDLPPCTPSHSAPTSTPTGTPDDGPACDSGGHTTVTPEGPPKQPVDPVAPTRSSGDATSTAKTVDPTTVSPRRAPKTQAVSATPAESSRAGSDLPPCSPPSDSPPDSDPTGLPDDGAACDSGGHTTVTTEGPPRQPVSPSGD
jgi:hypothetical protein